MDASAHPSLPASSTDYLTDPHRVHTGMDCRHDTRQHMRHVSLLKKHGFSPTDTQRAVSRIAHLEDVTERGDLAVFLYQEQVIAQHCDRWYSVSTDEPRRVFLNLSHDLNPKSREGLVPPRQVIDSLKHWYDWVYMKYDRLFPIKEGEFVVTADFRNLTVVHLPGDYANFFLRLGPRKPIWQLDRLLTTGY